MQLVIMQECMPLIIVHVVHMHVYIGCLVYNQFRSWAFRSGMPYDLQDSFDLIVASECVCVLSAKDLGYMKCVCRCVRVEYARAGDTEIVGLVVQ